MRTQISLPQPVPETVRSQRSPFVMGVKHFVSLNLLITQRPEGSAQLLTEDLRLFPGGEVAALISLVPVDEVAEGTSPQTVQPVCRNYYTITTRDRAAVMLARVGGATSNSKSGRGPGFEPGASRSRTVERLVQKRTKRSDPVRNVSRGPGHVQIRANLQADYYRN